MKKCTLFHTGVYELAEGVIKDNLVYLIGRNDELYFPEEMFMAREECEGDLIQFEVDGKWGFADIYTGEVKIKPIWEYAGPFYRGYAHVVLGSKTEVLDRSDIHVEGGKHGYIDAKGSIVLPLDYDDAADIPLDAYFNVAKKGKWGLVDIENKEIIALSWDLFQRDYGTDLIFCGVKEFCDPHPGAEDRMIASIFNTESEATCEYTIKWAVFDRIGNMIVEPILDEKPVHHRLKGSQEKYYILKSKRKYGVLCGDGRLISNITLLKREAINLIERFSRYS